jgi:cell division protein FtsB
MIKKTLYLVTIVSLIVIFYGLGRQIFESLEADRRLNDETESLMNLQQENSLLKKQLAEVESVSFIEQQARDNLNFSRPGEVVMVVPPEEIDKLIAQTNPQPLKSDPNWLGWWKLFIP